MADLVSPSWPLYCSALLGLTVAYLLITSTSQYLRLRHIPGPPLAAWTNFWLMRHMHHKDNFHVIRKRLHQEYGPIQRYGPNRVMFSDPTAIPIILGWTSVFIKASNHGPIKAYNNGQEILTFIAETDDARAARLKRNLHPTFSPTGVLAYESHVDHTVTELVTHLRAVGPTANLTDWGIWFAFDTVARVAFSEDQGFMRSRTDVGGAAEASRQRFGHWNLYWAIPWLDALLYKNWWVRRSKRAPSGMARLAMRAIARRAEKDGAGADNDILGLFIRSSEKDPELYTPARIVGMTISTMQAGSETTGYTTAICLWHLLANPRVLARLRRELEDVAPTTADGWALPSASALRGTNYLEACVKESNRIRPTVNIPAEREVPAGGSTIAGVFIPGGTIVACNTAGLYTDPSIWGDDVETYRPERWLEASEEQRVKMKRADLLFITGKRMCLGLHMAWLEMRKVIPALVMNFEMELVHPGRELYQKSGFFAEPGEILVKLAPRTAA